MSDKTSDHSWKSSTPKTKELNISEILRKSMTDDSHTLGRVNLRDVLVQRTMDRHEITKEQALALILAFGG